MEEREIQPGGRQVWRSLLRQINPAFRARISGRSMAAWILSNRARADIRPCISPRPPEVKRRPVRGLFRARCRASVPNRQKCRWRRNATGLMRPTLGLTRAASRKRGPRALGEHVAIVAAIGAREDDEARVAIIPSLAGRAVAGLTGAIKANAAAGPAFGRSPARGCPSRARRPPGPRRSPDPAPAMGEYVFAYAVAKRRYAMPVGTLGGHRRAIVTLTGRGAGADPPAGSAGARDRDRHHRQVVSQPRPGSPERNGRRPGRAVNVPSAKKKAADRHVPPVASACASATPDASQTLDEMCPMRSNSGRISRLLLNSALATKATGRVAPMQAAARRHSLTLVGHQQRRASGQVFPIRRPAADSRSAGGRYAPEAPPPSAARVSAR